MCYWDVLVFFRSALPFSDPAYALLLALDKREEQMNLLINLPNNAKSESNTHSARLRVTLEWMKTEGLFKAKVNA